MKPLFEIGQEVILVGSNNKIYDNNHIVTDMKYWENGEMLSGKKITGWGYEITNDPQPDGHWYREEHLRPKPKGTGKSYTEFMNELKKDKVVTI